MVAPFERLAEDGNSLRFAASRALGAEPFKLGVRFNRVARRITFYFADDPSDLIIEDALQAEAERARRSAAGSPGDATVPC